MNNIKIDGYFEITPKLTDLDRFYLNNFHATNHIKRDPDLLWDIYKGRQGYIGSYGDEGEFFIKYYFDSNGKMFQNNDNGDLPAIIDQTPPGDQPSIHCPWYPSHDGEKLLSNNTPHYKRNYAWLKWLLKNFLQDRYKLNGRVTISNDTREISIDLKDNETKIRSKSIEQQERRIKTNTEIIESLIEDTKNNIIKWEKNNKWKIPRLETTIQLNKNVKLDILLVVRDILSNKNYINIYIKKGESSKLLKNIKSYKVNKLMVLILESLKIKNE